MPRKRHTPATGVSIERAIRLYRLLNLLARGPQTRTAMMRKLRLGIRGYYRDLEALRKAGIIVELSNGRYRLVEEPALAIERLPVPDPGLTLGEARLLARGRSPAHKKIREQVKVIEGQKTSPTH